MKQLLLKTGAFLGLLAFSSTIQAQCLTASLGLYPDDTYIPNCIGNSENVVGDAYAGDYSNVQLTEGVTYIFSSSVATDYLTIGNEDGGVALAFGVSPVTYTATTSGVFRFYTHVDELCGELDEVRARRVQCGEPPVCDPVSLPYTLGFETGETACLTIQDVNGGSNSGWAVENDFPTENGVGSMLYTYDSDLVGDDWFFTEGLIMGGVEHTLTFNYRGGIGPDFIENLEVRYGNAANAAAMIAPALLTFNDIDTNFGDDYTVATVNFTPSVAGTYYIGFHSTSDLDQGYIQIDDVVVTTTLATKGFNNNAFAHYPNPVKDKWNFSYTQKVLEITIYNLLGQVVLQQTVNATSGQADLSNLVSGTYMVKLTSGDTVKTIKIMKQ